MEKIKIKLNGKPLDFEVKDLYDFLKGFCNALEEVDKKYCEECEDVPSAYDDYVDYLSLSDFRPQACLNNETVRDLGDKLVNRLNFIRKYPEKDYAKVKENLIDLRIDINKSIEEFNYMCQALNKAKLYCDTIIDLEKI